MSDYITLLAIPGAGELEKTLENLILHNIGTDSFLLLVVVVAIIYIIHLQFRLIERDDREISLQQQISASKAMETVLEGRLKLADDRTKLVEERARIIEQQRILSEQKYSAGEELLALMNRTIRQFPRAVRDCRTAPRSILLVEDEKSIHIYKEGIEDAFPGTEVRTANNGDEALEAIAKRPPSLVVTDLVMPVLDGYELVRRLARQYPGIPVLVVSGYADRLEQVTDKIDVLPLQFEFLPKPLWLRTLLGAIERLLSDHSAEEEANSVAI